MKQIPFFSKHVGTEFEECSRRVDVAGASEGVGCPRPIARPYVAVRVASKLQQVGIIRSDNAAMIVRQGAKNEEATCIELGDFRRYLDQLLPIGFGPKPPIISLCEGRDLPGFS